MGDRPDEGGIVIDLPGDGGSSGGSSSSSSSSSGSSAPAIDPIVAKRMALFSSIYLSIWGEPATDAYLRSAANRGWNSYEFAVNERSKPAYLMSRNFEESFDSRGSFLANLGVFT